LHELETFCADIVRLKKFRMAVAAAARVNEVMTRERLHHLCDFTEPDQLAHDELCEAVDKLLTFVEAVEAAGAATKKETV
jgi:hypothetical protein